MCFSRKIICHGMVPEPYNYNIRTRGDNISADDQRSDRPLMLQPPDATEARGVDVRRRGRRGGPEANPNTPQRGSWTESLGTSRHKAEGVKGARTSATVCNDTITSSQRCEARPCVWTLHASPSLKPPSKFQTLIFRHNAASQTKSAACTNSTGLCTSRSTR